MNPYRQNADISGLPRSTERIRDVLTAVAIAVAFAALLAFGI